MEIVSLSLLIIALLILFGLFSAHFFRIWKIPDVLLLVALGAVLKQFGLFPAITLESTLMKVLLTVALIYIVFSGGLPIRVKAFFFSAKKAFFSSVLNFILISAVITGITLSIFHDLRLALTLGFLMCVMDSSIINGILSAFKFSKRGEAFVQMESAMIDIFVIVSIVSIWIEKIEFSALAQQVLLFLLFSSAIGIIFAIIFSFLLKKMEGIHHISLATLAALIILYVFCEYFGANGVIGIFAFAITLGNLKSITHLIYKEDSGGIGYLSRDQIFFFNEFSFLLRTLLFIFLGTLIDFSIPSYLAIGAGFSILAITIRSFILRLINLKAVPEKEIYMIHVMAAKGLTPVVLMAMISSTAKFNNIIIGAIFSSIIISSILFFLIDRDKFSSISYCFFPKKGGKKIESMKEVSNINSFEKY